MKKYISTNQGIFEVLSKPTKKVAYLLRNACYWELNPNGHPRSIWDAYKNPSRAKEDIFKAWADWFGVTFVCDSDRDFRIVSHNCNFFSIACRFGDTLFYITPHHNYMIDLNKDVLSLVNNYKEFSLFRGL